MKRFNEFIKQLSLTQQLFALIFCFVTFFALFFFVYLNGNVDQVLRGREYDMIKENQETSVALKENTILSGQDKYPVIANVQTISFVIQDGRGYQSSNLGASEAEWECILNDIATMNKKGASEWSGFYPGGKKDSYYYITKVDDNQYLISRSVSSSFDKYKDELVSRVIYITVIVVGFFFIILMMWVRPQGLMGASDSILAGGEIQKKDNGKKGKKAPEVKKA